MTAFLLDTNTISAAMWKTPDQGVLHKLREHGGECAMAAPTWHELRYGVARFPKGKRRGVLESFLENVIGPTILTLPYDERAAEWHALERVRLERSGKTPPFADGQIAAIAVTNGLPLVTDNLKDFKGFRGLKTLNWLAR